MNGFEKRMTAAKVFGLVSVSVMGLMSVPAYAQEADPVGAAADDGRIVVTATRRAQSTQDVPLAVKAVSAEELVSAQIDGVQDLSKIDPALSAQNFGPGAQTIVIRGISSATGPTVGVYLDELPLSGAFNGDVRGDSSVGLNLVDIERVEVLKGPQGTLFGSGSMTGTIRYISVKPQTDVIEGFVEGSAALVKSGNELFSGNAMLNVPIIRDVAAVRVVGWADEDGGFIDQLLPDGTINENVNDQSTRGFRAQVLVNPTDRLTIVGAYNYQDIDVDGVMWWQGDSPDDNPLRWYNNAVLVEGFQFLLPPQPDSWRDIPRGPYLNDMPTRELYRDRYRMWSVTADYEADFGTFMAAYSNTDKNGMAPFDSTGTAYSFGLPFLITYSPDIQFDDWTIEGRFSSDFDGPLQVVLGGFYQKSKSIFNGTAVINRPGELAPCFTSPECRAAGFQEPGGLSSVVFSAADFHNVKQRAFYGQLDYELTDQLVATAGVRYFKAETDDSNVSYQDIAPDYFAGIVTTPYETGALSGKNSKWTYNFSLLYKATPDLSIYARTATGYRLGGVNVQKAIAENLDPTLIGVVPATYAPDKLTSYEVGVKAEVLDRLLSFEGAVYKIDWPGQQVQAQAAGAFEYVANASKVKTEGFEISANLRPAPGLTFASGLVYTNSRLAADLPPEAVAGGTIDLKGDKLPYVPKWSASLQARYEAPVSDDAMAYGQLGANFRDKTQGSFNPTDPTFVVLESYTLLDGQIGVQFDAVDVSLFGRNLTDKVAQMGVYRSDDGLRIFSPAPRTFGIKARVDF